MTDENNVVYGYADTDARADLAKKAYDDGYYHEMTVGDAEQLVATQTVSDKVPYLFRTSGGTADIGNREYLDKIVGGTVAWNQLASTSASKADGGITFTPETDGYVISGTASGKQYLILFSNSSFISGHKYLLFDDGDLANYGFWPNTELSTNKHAYFISSGNLTLTVNDGVTMNNVKLHPQLFDLTQMFGSTIADYIYTLETATAGAGVSWFRSLFPSSYYAYNAGELKHVTGLSSHDMVGFNQWDEEWEVGSLDTNGANVSSSTQIRSKNYIPVFGGQTYYIKSPYTNGIGIYQYDYNKAYINRQFYANTTVTLYPNTRYIRFRTPDGVTSYTDGICINLSWSGYRNGEYLPYEKHSYALDNTLTLRGIPKLDSSNHLYYDGDEYKADGTVNRRFGIVDLGTLTWSKDTTSLANPAFRATVSDKKPGSYNGICGKYIVLGTNRNILDSVDKCIAPWNTTSLEIGIRDDSYASSTADQFKTAMSGVYLVYELATPTEETATAYNLVQWVDDFGTEEFVSTGIVPVGHETRYPANLRDKLQHLPDLAESKGTYLVIQEDDQMTLTPYSAPTGLPTAPTTDGNYQLKCTVADGTATYTWEAIT